MSSSSRYNQPTSPLHSSHNNSFNQDDDDDDNIEGDDLINDNMLDDYRAIPALDVYENVGLNDEAVEEMTIEQRLAAEAQLNQRDAENMRRSGRSRLPIALRGMESSDNIPVPDRRQRRVQQTQEYEDENLVDQTYVNIDEMSGSVRKLLEMENVSNEVGRRFQNFISSYRDPSRPTNELLYFDRMGVMCQGISLKLI